MIPFSAAKEIIEKNLHIKNQFEEIPVYESLGRICYEDIFAKENLLNFKRCAYDGFAIKEENNFEGKELTVIDSINAGEISKFKVQNGFAVEVSTGCVLPENADIVIRKEFVEKIGKKIKIIKKETNKNYDEIGSDVKKGDLIIKKNEIINPQKIALLIATGNSKIKVMKKIKVGIISTGDELINLNENLSIGKIYDSNSFMIYACLSKFKFFDLKNYGILKDDYEKIKELLKNSDCEILIMSGGTSTGEKDIAYKVIEKDGKMLFHKISVKPGKPTFFGIFNNKFIFGLPGNPAGCFLILHSLILPSILKNFNLRQISIKATVKEGIKTKDRTEIIPFKILKNKEIEAIPTFKHSGAISSFSNSNGYALIKENTEIKAKSLIEIFLYEYY